MMTRKLRLSRRSVLRGALGATVALPWLEAMGQAAAPKRFIVVFTPNGTVPSQFWPTGTESAYTFPRILQPLERHKADLLILKGVHEESARHGPGESHTRGIGHILTGTELLEGSDKNGAGLGGGISVDQAIANEIGAGTTFKSLEFGVVARGVSSFSSVDAWTRLSFTAAGVHAPAENSPWAMFNRVFATLPDGAGPAPADPNVARRRDILEAIAPQYAALASRLGTQDRQRLEAHLTAISEMQQKLQAAAATPTVGGACQKPAMGTQVDYKSDANMPVVGKLQMDLLATAIACGLTHVASLQWSRAYGLSVMGFAGDSSAPITEGHHAISHDTDAASQEKLVRINTWYAEQLAYLIDKLKSFPEGSGTVFDNTAILWCNELGEGASHTTRDIPFVIAGKLGGAFRTGRFLTFPGRPHNDLLVSLLNAYGVGATTFGNPAYCTGPLSGLG